MEHHNRAQEPVKFLVALTFSDESKAESVLSSLCDELGDSDISSTPFDFNHTCYYEREMGNRLRKKFVGFSRLGPREALVNMKLSAQALERENASNNRRVVNIDPAYLELSKLVVASSKNFAHRIYIGAGVFGDVQLRFESGRFTPLEWTYPDYLTETTLDFLCRLRATYHNQLRQR